MRNMPLGNCSKKKNLDIEDEANSRHEITHMNSSILFKWTRLKGGLTGPSNIGKEVTQKISEQKYNL